MTTIQEVAANADFGKPSAAKRGRNPRFPYVPVIDFGAQATGVYTTRTTQIRGKAFATRDEAVAYAAERIEAERAHLAEMLGQRGYRALREHYGLPRELDEVTA